MLRCILGRHGCTDIAMEVCVPSSTSFQHFLVMLQFAIDLAAVSRSPAAPYGCEMWNTINQNL